MRHSLRLYLLLLCIMSGSMACRHQPYSPSKLVSDQRKIDSLILRGDNYINIYVDSVYKTASELSLIAKRTNNKTALAYSELLKARYFWLFNDRQKSMTEAFKALSDAKKWKITRALPSIYRFISWLNIQSNNIQLGFDAQQKGLSWARFNKDTAAIISLLNLKGMFIHSINQTSGDSARLKVSINLFMSGLELAASSSKYEEYKIPLYDNIAQYYIKDEGNYPKAIDYARRGVALALKHHWKRALTYCYVRLGEAYFNSGKKQTGIHYLNQALRAAYEVKGAFRILDIKKELIDFYYLSGSYKKAVTVSNEAHALLDSLNTDNRNKQAADIRIKHELSKEEREILHLDHARAVENRQLVAILGVSLFCIALTIMAIFQYRLISRSNKLIKQSNEKKDEALANIAFIQAHELRRPLASIMGLVNVIKATDHNFDPETVEMLHKAGLELDEKVHDVLKLVEVKAK